MALIKCRDCGRDISTLAPACLNCGRPMENNAPHMDEIISPISKGQRIACPDGNCIGIIGEFGNCRTCGKHYLWVDDGRNDDMVTMEEQPCLTKCLKCGSTQLSTQKKGFGLGKSVAGVCVLGPIGLLGGFIGSDKVQVTCISCGNSWQVGEIKKNIVICWQCGKTNVASHANCISCNATLL